MDRDPVLQDDGGVAEYEVDSAVNMTVTVELAVGGMYTELCTQLCKSRYVTIYSDARMSLCYIDESSKIIY